DLEVMSRGSCFVGCCCIDALDRASSVPHQIGSCLLFNSKPDTMVAARSLDLSHFQESVSPPLQYWLRCSRPSRVHPLCREPLEAPSSVGRLADVSGTP